MTQMQEVLINGRWPLMLPEHRANFAPLTTPPYWESERLAHMHEHIKPGDVVFDVGSEEGDLPALWASWGAGVVPFEPNPKVWPNIRASFEANGYVPEGCFAGFAGDRDRKVSPEFLSINEEGLNPWPDCATGPIITDHGFCNLNERPDIPAIRLDHFAYDYLIPPEHITIDVEGAELYVLLGAHGLLRDYPPKLWISSHPTFQQAMYGYEEADLLAFLDSVNYRYELLAEDHERHFFAEPK